MGEPIVLHNAEGQTLNVYTRNQAEALIDGGQWFATPADAEAGKHREKPTPATAAKLDALEGGADVTEGAHPPIVVEAAPPSPAPDEPGKRTAAKRSTGKQ